ncbi:ERI1 exoribonuclease 3 [Irineochytrium annulatum]|nr:ERI1 exoribonuclease 3 [Irineochytrium annulatum]
MFSYLAVLDFEASCIRTGPARSYELVEFPTLLVSTKSGSVEAEFHVFVQPKRHLPISDHYLRKKNIDRTMLESSPTFPDALESHSRFLDAHGCTSENTLFVLCGDWDLKHLLPVELEMHGLARDAAPRMLSWCNIKAAFKEMTGKDARGMVRMLNLIGETLDGTHHSGIDDCRNIAKVARWMLSKGWEPRATWVDDPVAVEKARAGRERMMNGEDDKDDEELPARAVEQVSEELSQARAEVERAKAVLRKRLEELSDTRLLNAIACPVCVTANRKGVFKREKAATVAEVELAWPRAICQNKKCKLGPRSLLDVLRLSDSFKAAAEDVERLEAVLEMAIQRLDAMT